MDYEPTREKHKRRDRNIYRTTPTGGDFRDKHDAQLHMNKRDIQPHRHWLKLVDIPNIVKHDMDYVIVRCRVGGKGAIFRQKFSIPMGSNLSSSAARGFALGREVGIGILPCGGIWSRYEDDRLMIRDKILPLTREAFAFWNKFLYGSKCENIATSSRDCKNADYVGCNITGGELINVLPQPARPDRLLHGRSWGINVRALTLGHLHRVRGFTNTTAWFLHRRRLIDEMYEILQRKDYAPESIARARRFFELKEQM